MAVKQELPDEPNVGGYERSDAQEEESAEEESGEKYQHVHHRPYVYEHRTAAKETYTRLHDDGADTCPSGNVTGG